MLDENHNDRGRKLFDESVDDRLVQSRGRSVFEPSGHFAQDREDRLLLWTSVMPVYEPTDHGVEKNDECSPERRDEEKRFGPVWHPSSCKITSTSYQVKHSQSR